MKRLLARFVPSTPASRAFLAITAIQSVVVVALEAIIVAKGSFVHSFFSTSDAPDETSVLPVYLGIFVLATVFQLVLSVDAIASRNTIEIIGLDVFQLMMLVYGVIQISEIKNAFSKIKTSDDSIDYLCPAIPAMLGLTLLIYLPLTWQLLRDFGWDVFKTLGADRRIRRCYASYQIFVTCLKFDYLIFCAFSLQFVLLVLSQGDIEKYLTLGAVPLSLLILIMGYVAVRRENKILTIVFLVFLVLSACYFAFKLFRIFQNTGGIYTLVAKSLTVFSVIALLMSAATIAAATICFNHFGQGLKGALSRNTNRPKAVEAGYSDAADPGTPGEHYKLQSAASSRMSID